MTTTKTAPNTPPAVYLVADNLDAVLAAGEDLLRMNPSARGSATKLAEAIRVLEMTIAARCMQARARAMDLRTADARYRALIDLFLAGTRPLADAIDELGDSTSADFQSGGCPITFLRSRQVISSEAAGLDLITEGEVSDRYLVAERIQLGSLLDLCATFLDRLEDHYELYAMDEKDSADGIDSAGVTDDEQVAA